MLKQTETQEADEVVINLPAIIKTDKSAAFVAMGTPEERLKQAEQQYGTFKIQGTTDKLGYEAAKEGIKLLRTTRTTLEKKRKEIVKPANDFVDEVNKFAKDATSRIAKLETHLKGEVDTIDKAKEIEKQKLIEERTKEMKLAGYIFDGNFYAIGTAIIHPSKIEEFDDEQWKNTIDFGTREKARIDEQKAKEEAARLAKEEADRQEKENLRLEKEASDKALAEAQKRIADLEAALKPKEEPVVTAEQVEQVAVNNTATGGNFHTKPDPTITKEEVAPPPAATAFGPSADLNNLVKRTTTVITGPGTKTSTPVRDPREDNPNFAHYRGGYNTCKKQVLDKLNHPDKFTRAELIEFVNNLKP